MSFPVGADEIERRAGCQCLFGKEGERHSARSLESHGEHYPWSADRPTTAKRSTGWVGDHICGCLSHRWSIIGLPKVPDTKFKRQSHAAGCRPNGPKGSSGRPAISIIPPEAALGAVNRAESGPAACEPSSPNVSCIGRVKLKKKEARRWTSAITGGPRKHADGRRAEPEGSRRAGTLLRMKRFFAGSRTKLGHRPGSPSAPGPDAGAGAGAPAHPLKRFASARQPAAFADLVFENCGQNEDSEICRQSESSFEDSKIRPQHEEVKKPEKGASMRMSNGSEWDEESQVSEESTVAHSCSILLEKKCINDEPLPVPTTERSPPSEINLWKRRPVGPIKPLDLGNARGNGFRKPSTV